LELSTLKVTQNFNKKFTFIDLFAGIGGFRIALETFGGKCAFSSEWDKYAAITYEHNFGEKPAGDITKIKEEEIPYHDVLCAGFPCQAFSISGKQGGFNDTRGTLFFDIARIAKYRKPKVLFLENVKNLARHDNGKTLSTITRVLFDIGYNVFFEILDSSDFGIPQSRKRVFFVCFDKKIGIDSFEFPRPKPKPVILKDILQPDSETSEFVINRKDIKINKDAFPKKDMFGNYPQKPIRIGIINKGGQGERIYSIYAHAITLSAYGGGVAAKTGAYLVNGRIRKLTPRECLRLLGFPENFELPVPLIQAYKQCGNSVVIPVVKEIFKKIIETGVL